MIDAHHHFWDPARGDYGWMKGEALKPITRVFGPDDLAPHLRQAGISRTVLVQAAPTVAETDYMLRVADDTAFVAKVVGWIDFENRSDLRQLERLAKHPKFSGVRPMIQDLPDPQWMHRKNVQWAFEAIIDLDLTFDALGFPLHLDPFLRLFESYPDLRAVIDHCMKPAIRDGAFAPWADKMQTIARETQVYCKLSGLVTEAAAGWTPESLRPYVQHVSSAFGTNRLMWGSDWPVLNLNGSYDAWLGAARALIPPQNHQAVFENAARQFYRLND